jgi:cyanophycinase-like exopeptidase
VIEVPLLRASDGKRADVLWMLSEAALVYILGGDPGYLGTTLLQGVVSPRLAQALAQGRAVAGSSAGAMVLAERVLLRSRNPRPDARHAVGGMAVVPGTVVIPHFERVEQGWLEAAHREAPDHLVLGLDECTGAVWDGRGWRAHGPGRVVVMGPGSGRAEHRDGDAVELPDPVV